MKLINLIFFILFPLFVFADDDSSSSSSSEKKTTTMVWVTGTDSAGVTKTTQSPFYQSFMTTYTSEVVSNEPKLGNIGLGSLSNTGNIGKVRSYTKVTISQAGASSLLKNSHLLANGSGLSFASYVAVLSVGLGFFYTVFI
ncbi:hypothetical protein HYPBUDRAFT_7782 [Hyphopichia burtonii NRRL Y-1933]|uniref:Protein KRE1 n=1 Tax=Hyphopichia burtonii NRRL Y-1933 TaxID=984485 RepID=A0A1E4REE8_9ASCO|nr:hypothetical protein HYPBUDRAFT_7782 [Hyphopichia burtonii NRRL Y-1933]ODV65613.1 hypothetical protein HYPBUDRAFT_7782 [Hyphopichia burtonii NRRL Y-1933]